MRRRGADTVGENLQDATNVDHEGAGDGRDRDPGAGFVLHLEAVVLSALEQVRHEHAVLVGSHALEVGAGVALEWWWWVARDFEPTKWGVVEQAGQRAGTQIETLFDKKGKVGGEGLHGCSIIFNGFAESGCGILVWPLRTACQLPSIAFGFEN